MNEFELKILRLNWVGMEDDSYDLCAHGDVYVRVGDEIVSDHESGNWTLSTTGLYLLRTLENDYDKTKYASQLLPCCGFTRVEDQQHPDMVVILGCPTGIDWTIQQVWPAEVRHTTERGVTCLQDFKDFKSDVIEFVTQVEGFYSASAPRKMPEDAYDKRMYVNFWREWNMLKERNHIDTGFLISAQ